MTQGNFNLGIFQEKKLTGEGGVQGVEQVPIHGNGVTKIALRQRHGLLPPGGALVLAGTVPPWPERCHIKTGVEMAVVACHGVLYPPK